MTVSDNDRQVLRELAKRVAEIASLPVQADRARLWKDTNALRPRRPLVLAKPEGGWLELAPESQLQCEFLRDWEMTLRRRIFRHEHIHDDCPITDTFDVGQAIRVGDYGVKVKEFRTEARGAYRWDPPIKSAKDIEKLHPRSVEVDRQRTRRNIELALDLFGDILRVRTRGIAFLRAKLTRVLIHLRGFGQMMLDMYDNPGLLHDLMAFLRDDMLHVWECYEREGVLSLNNGPDDILGSGGVGHTDELPAKDFQGRVRMKDMWCWGESQECVGVGPQQFYEFVLKYQLPLMNRFGLVDYGCCEPLADRLGLLIQHIPRLRWVSVSPWCDRQVAAEKLADKYVYVYKPNPSTICSPKPDYDAAEKELCETLNIASGCCIQLVMKDTHTFHNEPERITRWTDIASRLATTRMD